MNSEKLLSIPELETKHYFLRGMTLDDAKHLFNFLSNHETMKFITPHPVKTIKEVEESIQSSIQNFKNTKEIPWVIINKYDQDLIGVFRLHKLNMWHKKTEMGVVIRKDYQNKGVMSELLPAVLSYGFNILGLNRIVGDIFAGNKASEKLLLKYGFTKEGQLQQTDFDGEQYHDTVVYSILKNEFHSIYSAWNEF